MNNFEALPTVFRLFMDRNLHPKNLTDQIILQQIVFLLQYFSRNKQILREYRFQEKNGGMYSSCLHNQILSFSASKLAEHVSIHPRYVHWIKILKKKNKKADDLKTMNHLCLLTWCLRILPAMEKEKMSRTTIHNFLQTYQNLYQMKLTPKEMENIYSQAVSLTQSNNDY